MAIDKSLVTSPVISAEKIRNSPGGVAGCQYDMSGTTRKQSEYRGTLGFKTVQSEYQDLYKVNRFCTTTKKKFRQFIDEFPCSGPAVDLGCGLGSAILHFLYQKGKIEQVISIDLDKRNLAINRLPGVRVMADITKPLLQPQSVGLAVCMWATVENGYTHTRTAAIAEEIWQMLKPGGMVITDYTKNYPTPYCALANKRYNILFVNRWSFYGGFVCYQKPLSSSLEG